MKTNSLLFVSAISVCCTILHADAAPSIMSAHRSYVDYTQIQVVFSEPLSMSTATNVLNYTINNGITVFAAGLSPDQSTVTLDASVIQNGSSDTLTVNGVQGTNGDTIAANSQILIQTAPLLPAEFGTTVNGFQDDFDAATRSSDWQTAPPGVDPTGNLFVQTNDTIVATDGPYESPHLLYEPTNYSYDLATQDILARVRIVTDSVGYAFNYGVGTGIDTGTSQGLDLIFADNPANIPPNFPDQHFMLVQFGIGWGPSLVAPDGSTPIEWQPNTWYWVRLHQQFQMDGTNSGFAKVWLADGDTPEPTNWSQVWNFAQYSDQVRNGFAGLCAAMNSEPGEAIFDYVLIQANGLPSILPSAESFTTPAGPSNLSIAQQPQSVTNYQGLAATFSVSVNSSYPIVFYRWEQNIGGVWQPVGQDTSSYTTPTLYTTNSGTMYRVSVSIPGTNVISSVVAATVNPSSMGITQQPTNTTVEESLTATFSVASTNSINASPTYQWQRLDPSSTNWADIASAVQSSYMTPALSISNDNGAEYRVTVSIPGLSETSDAAILTVVPYTNSPTVVLARRLIQNNAEVNVIFDEPVSSSAETPSNYTINGGIAVDSASQGNSGNSVLLTISPAITNGSLLTLTINGVQDLFGNTIVANTQVPISLAPLLPADVGTVVSGFQDNFPDDSALNTNWYGTPASYAESGQAFNLVSGPGGYLQVGKANRETPSLQYRPSTPYDSENQEVLALVELTGVTATNSGDAFSAGIGVGINPVTSDDGVDFVFRNTPYQAPAGFPNPHVQFLRPAIAWGPGLYTDANDTNAFTWSNGTWYWMRVKQQFEPGGPDAVGKVWLADGDTPEPQTWGGQWDFASTTNDLSQGFAGILAGDAQGGGDGLPALSGEYMNVQYVLIEAAGLPNIVVWPDVAGPRLFTTIQGGSMYLSWNGTATLQFASQITGPWSDVVGASSPYLVTPQGSQGFYRLEQ